MRKFVKCAAVLGIFYAGTAHSIEQKYSVLSRCFFIYAPIFETGKKLQNSAVFIYGQKRISWVGGYIQGQQNNPAFEAAFEHDLKINKKAGIDLDSRLAKAILTSNVEEYSAVMAVARECDKLLGLPTNDIPLP